ncbi:sodium:solute symporter [Massilia sp. DWR3-1-1]|uniref:sodium:solute symporter n=1 Tax=Massilia sp. DWR3-1-1 TaxID=2804559 RepID=UPI003CF39B12
MSPTLLFFVVLAYFGVLLTVARLASRNATSESFFNGNKNSNWVVVAIGMIGTSLSGVTFVSVPGLVGESGFLYFQLLLGQLIGYLVVAFVLLPVFYRLKLVSIYAVLGIRMGPVSRACGAWLFLVSRCIGAAARLYLVIIILQESILGALGVSYWFSAAAAIALIVLYTYQGGVKTIIWTDLLQTALMLTGLVAAAAYLLHALDLSVADSYRQMHSAGLARIFSHDVDSSYFWPKQLLAGMLISVAMTGMDQEMMQKNISVKSLRDSQKNIISMALAMTAVVFVFLFLGGLLRLFADSHGLQLGGDRIFPAIVFQHMPEALQLVFVIALISALFPSADGALTALTASYCIDIARLDQRHSWSEAQRLAFRRKVQLAFAVMLFLLLVVLKLIDSNSIVNLILRLAAITYGPLLGLFCFAVLSRRTVADRKVPLVVLSVPLLCFVLDQYQAQLFGTYRIGLEMLAINGALTWLGLVAISTPRAAPASAVAP